LQELLARVENDWDLLRDLAGIFKEDFPRYEESLRTSIESGNTTQTAEAAHSLKGMLSNLAAAGAAAAASELEQLAKQGRQSELSASFARFEKQTEGLMAELESYMAGAQK